jgi:hypothetical protein
MLVNGKVKVDLFKTNKLKLDEGIRNLFNSQRDRSVVKYMIIPN